MSKVDKCFILTIYYNIQLTQLLELYIQGLISNVTLVRQLKIFSTFIDYYTKNKIYTLKLNWLLVHYYTIIHYYLYTTQKIKIYNLNS